jgi:tetratricopeptide (TPR) repeat protein
MNEEINDDPIDFATCVFNHARSCEEKGDRRAALKSYAHAWRAAASTENVSLAMLARNEMYSAAILVNDLIFSSVEYRDLISTFTLHHRDMAAFAHHDLGKLFRNAWQHGEVVNPSDAIKHFIVSRDEFIELWEARSAALVEMDLAHIYMHIDKIDQSIALLESARATWKSLDEPSGSAECALSLGDCYTLLGRNDDAVRVYQLAAIDFESAGNLQQMELAAQRANTDDPTERADV